MRLRSGKYKIAPIIRGNTVSIEPTDSTVLPSGGQVSKRKREESSTSLTGRITTTSEAPTSDGHRPKKGKITTSSQSLTSRRILASVENLPGFPPKTEDSHSFSSMQDSKLVKIACEVKSKQPDEKHEQKSQKNQEVLSITSPLDQAEMIYQQAKTDYFLFKFKEALAGFTKAAEDYHYVPALLRLGEMHEYGDGTETSIPLAQHYYTLAASQIAWLKKEALTKPEAQLLLGWCYQVGDKGVKQNSQKMLQYYDDASQQGNAEAKYKLAACCEHGRGLEVDPPLAVKFYTDSALLGFTKAQFNLAVCHHQGFGTPVNLPLAMYWYKKAIQQGYFKAKTNLAEILMTGDDHVIRDEKTAFRLCQEAAAQGDLIALFNLANYFECGLGVTKSLPDAYARYVTAAQRGNAAAQLRIGFFLQEGLTAHPFVIPPNVAHAVLWFNKAAGQMHPEALYQMGLCCEHGVGVEKDAKQAFANYSIAAERGHAEAQNSLGDFFESGTGTPRDLISAIQWYERAASQNHAVAYNSLGVCFEFGGPGVGIDMPRAVACYQAAANLGYARAKFNLGFCYLHGQGVAARDVGQALALYREAVALGCTDAQPHLEALLKTMPPPPPRGLPTQSSEVAMSSRSSASCSSSLFAQAPAPVKKEIITAATASAGAIAHTAGMNHPL